MNSIICGDALRIPLPDNCVQMCVTSPPYWKQRLYAAGTGELGQEWSVPEYVENMVSVFRQVKRVLRDDGLLFLNLGDKFDKRKSMIGLPWRVAFKLMDDGWILRADCIWSKTNAMPFSGTDRPTLSHEYVFIFSKQSCYASNFRAIATPIKESSIKRLGQDVASRAGPTRTGKTNGTMKAVRFGGDKAAGYGDNAMSGKEWIPAMAGGAIGLDDRKGSPLPTANIRSVWSLATAAYKGAHFATFPIALARMCIKAGSKLGDMVMDPFSGASTTGLACKELGRRYIGVELNVANIHLSNQRKIQPEKKRAAVKPLPREYQQLELL